MAKGQQTHTTVWLQARVPDASKIKVTERRVPDKKHKGAWRIKRSYHGGYVYAWSLKLERWTPAEVRQIIIDTFTRLAKEAAPQGARDGTETDSRADGSLLQP